MAYQQKEGQGSLFKNDKQNDRQPDFKGTIMIKGVLYSVSAWNRTSQNGKEYISLQAEERQADGQHQSGYQGSYQAPQQPAYNAPQQSYQPQRPAYTAPQPSYNAPQQPTYTAPQPSYPPQNIPAPGIDDIPADNPDDDLPF